MLTLPNDVMPVIGAFRQVFSERVWDWAQVLLVGSILAPHIRTVTAALRVMGLSHDRQFQNFHRVLNRAKWSGLVASQILLGLLIAAFVAIGMPLIIGADETLERRRGKHIAAKSVFRDAVRSSKKHTVYSFGLRWVSLMVLVPVPWIRRHLWTSVKFVNSPVQTPSLVIPSALFNSLTVAIETPARWATCFIVAIVTRRVCSCPEKFGKRSVCEIVYKHIVNDYSEESSPKIGN